MTAIAYSACDLRDFETRMTALPIARGQLPIVALIGTEPLASSLALAQGLHMPHASIIKLIRKHRVSMERFGPLGFEIQKGCALPQGGFAKATELALLSEHQATLLISMMRNTPIAVECKVRLVEEFFRMRAQLAQQQQGLWQQMQALIAREVDSQVRASFGAHLMLERKRSIPQLHAQIATLREEIEPMLSMFH